MAGYAGVYDGAAHGAHLVSATGVGAADLSASVTVGSETFINVPGGAVDWSFTNANYVSQNGTAVIEITPATATINVAGYAGVYDGAAHGAHLVSATGVGAADLSASVTVGSETFINVPGGAVDWSFTNANYVSQNGTAVIEITPATATINVAGYAGVYDGAAHGAHLVSATGVGAADLSASVTVGSETFINVPGGTVNWSFTNANYVSQNGTAVIEITPATATINVAGYAGVYDGAAHGAHLVSATGVGAADLSASVTVGSETFINVPGGAVDWSFTNANYVSQNGTAVIEITPATATINVAGYAGVYDGAAHGAHLVSATGVGAADLSASVTVGSETFINVPGGAVDWSFTNANYVSQNGTAAIEITKATSTTTTVGAGPFVYTGSTQTGGSGTVAGAGTITGSATVSYTGDQINVGTYYVTAHYAGDANHFGSDGLPVPIVITRKEVTVSGITANDKPFDGNTVATLNFGGATLVGVVADDIVTLNTVGATGTFATAAVGPKVVTIAGLTLGGPDSGNYSLTQPTAMASITAWSLSGFLQPVGIPNTYPGMPSATTNTLWNTIKGGQTVPLKFKLYASVGGTELTSVTDVQGFALAALPCAQGLEDPIDPDFSVPGGTILRYDGTQFIQNWQTPKGANQCYRITMTARDGSRLTAFFKTK